MTLSRRHVCQMLTAGFVWPLLCGTRPAHAAPLQRQSVIDMVTRAADALTQYGFPKALNHTPGEIWSRSGEGLYVFILDQSGTLLLHPDRKMEGENVIAASDANGKFFIRDMIAAAKAEPDTGCWTHYVWPKPDASGVGFKHTYAKFNHSLIIAAGYIADTA